MALLFVHVVAVFFVLELSESSESLVSKTPDSAPLRQYPVQKQVMANFRTLAIQKSKVISALQYCGLVVCP